MKSKEVKFDTINFLSPVLEPKDIWDKSYTWVMNAGRYILVVVEVVVLAAFFARFTLDRRRNDLDQNIESKVKNILGTDIMLNREAQYRLYQKFFSEINVIASNQKNNSALVKELLDNFPQNFVFQSFSYNYDTVNFVFKASSYPDIAKYTSYLNSTGKYENIIITLSKKGDNSEVVYYVDDSNVPVKTIDSDIDVTVTFKLKNGKI